jgi:hypothetical protein
MRGGQEDERTRGREDDKKRIGWSRGIECAEERWTLWGETCSATRRRVVVLKERDVEKGLHRQRGGRVFENLTNSNSDEKDEKGGAKLGGDCHFEGNWGLHFWMPIVDRKQKVKSRKSI